MNSSLLESMGLAGLDIGIVLVVLVVLVFFLLVFTIILCVQHSKLKKRFNRFSQGRDGKSLEKEIGDVFAQNTAIKEVVDKNKRDIKTLFRRMETTFQKVGLVKYDAFPQMGGKLSFSLAMLDEKNNGYIINSVHGSDGCYTYSKEIKSGRCDLVLGEEEKKALGMAMQM
ncbi:MAG: DUF4446 family protein [Lachnospiraceae bacterium]|nr:DUF4446 family protein [Lachnospiraceae bacterium]